MPSHDTERACTNLPAVMSEGDELSGISDSIDDAADRELIELQRRVERARDRIDDAGRALSAQLAAGETPPAPLEPEPVLAIPPTPRMNSAAAARSELEAFLAQNNPAAPPVEPEKPKAPLLPETPDFGDIAATIANDDDWKKP